jgi:hypothetical protein
MLETMQAPATKAAPYEPATAWPKEEMDRALEALVKRATTEAEFRALALRDPAAAFNDAAGKPLPDGFVLRLVDNGRAQLAMVLPDAKAAAPPPKDVRSQFDADAEWSESEARLATETLLTRASADAAFRAKAIANPATAIQELTGKPLPQGFLVRLFDNAHANLTVILPDLVEARTE